jgi:23S rRNA (cytosine1962-C5)-methyltransferase
MALADEGFWARRLALAVSWRVMGHHEARRLVNAESDGLPGLIVDRYGEWLVLQALTLGIEQFKPVIVQQLQSILRPRGIYERSDVEVREKEGLRRRAACWRVMSRPLGWRSMKTAVAIWWM